ILLFARPTFFCRISDTVLQPSADSHPRQALLAATTIVSRSSNPSSHQSNR
ncbi:hypothetical protein AAVH_43439, partial [Aphelenchoides avenae]